MDILMADTTSGGLEQSLRTIRNTVEYLKLSIWEFIRVPVTDALADISYKFREIAITFAPLFGEAIGGLVGLLTGAEGASGF